MKKNPKIVYGTKNLLPEKIELKDVLVHISIKIEADLLEALKAKAKKLNKPYQTLMKEMLREQLNMDNSEMEEQIRKIVRQEIKKLAG